MQYHWTHGKKPFDKSNEKDLLKLSKWQERSKNSTFYQQGINVWTVRDPLKRETAKKNGLKYLEIFPKDEKNVLQKIKEYLIQEVN